MYKNLFLLLLFCSLNGLSQHKYAKEFRLINDNDLYTSLYRDRYYSNGIFLSYSYLSATKKENIDKKIFTFQLGHHLYTPYKATVKTIAEHDRPFAGYLYGGFGITYFNKSESMLHTEVQIGVLGKAAFGKDLQDFIHNIYGFNDAEGWKYQIADAFALNFRVDYYKHLVKDNRNFYDITWINKARMGSVFTDIATGFYGRIGFKPLQKLANSIAFGGNLNDKKTAYYNEIESFIYIKPLLTYVLYDATIQGSFLNTNSPITYTVNPLKFSTELGIRFTSNRFNFGYAIHYHTKKLKSKPVKKNNIYGTLQVNYQFN